MRHALLRFATLQNRHRRIVTLAPAALRSSLFGVIAAVAAALVASGPAHAQPAAEPALVEATEASTFTSGDDGTLLYRLLRPLEPSADEPAEGDFPLLVFLHGFGERGDDNLRQLIHLDPFADAEWRARYPAFVLIPQCPADTTDDGRPVTWTARLAPNESPAMNGEPTPPMALVLELLDKLLVDLPIDRSRVYVAGLSMGGYGTWDFAARRPELIAAIAPICGGGAADSVAKFVDMPTWAFHGADDRVVPPVRSREMVEALRAAGGRPMLTEYPGVGHDSWRPALREQLLWDWMFAQRREP